MNQLIRAIFNDKKKQVASFLSKTFNNKFVGKNHKTQQRQNNLKAKSAQQEMLYHNQLYFQNLLKLESALTSIYKLAQHKRCYRWLWVVTFDSHTQTTFSNITNISFSNVQHIGHSYCHMDRFDLGPTSIKFKRTTMQTMTYY